MATYNEQEYSQFDGSIVELYNFYSEGFDTPITLTSGDEEIVYLGNTYVREKIKRSQPEISKETVQQTLTIILPATNVLADKYKYFIPIRTVWLTIYRFHRVETGTPEIKRYWQGRVRGVEIEGNFANVTCQPIDASFNRTGLHVIYQSTCQNFLYDENCRVNIEDYSQDCVVTAVNKDKITSPQFTVFPDLSPVPDGWWSTGLLFLPNGDMRTIINHTGIDITVISAFENLVPGTIVKISAGCDRLLETCDVKFNNTVNYRGWPYVPQTNLFRDRFDR